MARPTDFTPQGMNQFPALSAASGTAQDGSAQAKPITFTESGAFRSVDTHNTGGTVTVVGIPAFAVTNAIDSTAFDLNAAAFDSSTSISNDYILDSIQLNFSTTESKTVTVTDPDGTEIYRDTNTSQHVSIVDINTAFNTGENIRVQVTQFASPGTMDCLLKVKEGDLTLGGNPTVTRSGDNVISTTSFNSRDPATFTAGATFQGVSEDVSAFGRAAISIHSTNATDGTLTIEVSHDGTTFFGPTRDWADTSIATPHMWNIVEKFFRIKYVNGTTEATALSIQVQYSSNADIVLGHQLSEIVPAESEAQLVRPTNSFDLDTARIHIKGQSADFFFGENNALTNGTFEDVYAAGGDIQWQTTAAKIKIKSTHAADTAAGLGLQSVEIHGLDANGADQSEVLDLSGTTPVESNLSYIRVSLIHNEEVGTYGGSHQGTIEWRVTNVTFSSGDLLGQMTGIEGSSGDSVQFGYGEAQNGFTSVPLGKVMYITRIEVLPRASKPINVILYERDSLLTTADPFIPRRIIWGADEIQDSVEKEFKSHIKIKSLTDIWFRAEATGANAGVSVWLDYYLVDADSDGA